VNEIINLVYYKLRKDYLIFKINFEKADNSVS
jgi:hypothetical protein